MAKKATGKATKSSGKSSKKAGTAVARVSSSGGGRSGSNDGFDAGEAILKLLQSPLVAELIAVAATAALAAPTAGRRSRLLSSVDEFPLPASPAHLPSHTTALAP